MKVAIKFEGHDAENRLKELGLTFEDLTTSLSAGYLARSSCTNNDVPMYPGITQFNHTVRMLRQRLIPRGWEKSDKGGYSRIISPCGKYAIAVSSGCDFTGKAEYAPSTRHPKGNCTEDIVKANCTQLNFFSDNSQSDEEESNTKTTLILLYYDDENEIRGELSLPEAIQGGYITGWAERIILPIQKIDDFSILKEPDFGPEIEIEINKKEQ